jgi:hypothetical protein
MCYAQILYVFGRYHHTSYCHLQFSGIITKLSSRCFPVIFCYHSIVVGYGLDNQGFQHRQGLEIFLFTTISRPALGPTQPTTQWMPEALSLGVKWPVHKADHSPPSTAKDKCMELYLHSPIRFMAWCSVKNHRDNFTFTSYPTCTFCI